MQRSLRMEQLRIHRNTLRLSQTRLAKLADVSRFKICLFELGDGKLTEDEQGRIRVALEVEAQRLRALPDSFSAAPAGGGTAAA
jgi:predicted transcriptional regulator